MHVASECVILSSMLVCTSLGSILGNDQADHLWSDGSLKKEKGSICWQY